MDLGLSDKVALVTGASHGIGLNIAKKLYDEGCKLVLNAREEERLLQVAKQFAQHAFCVVADVTLLHECRKLIDKTIKQYEKLDILVCNVGLSHSVIPGQETATEWEKMLTYNFFVATNMIEAARPYLRETKGNIICIGSICGLEVIPEAPITYSVAKSALTASVRSLARPLGKEGVRINMVAPGNILFKGSVWDKKLQEDPKQVDRMLEKEVALQRLGTPEEIANCVAFLASTKASFTTGTVFVVDGGQIKH